MKGTLPFLRDVPVYFGKTMPRHILHVLGQHGFIAKELLDCLPLKIMEHKIREQRPRTVEHLSTTFKT